MVKYFNKENMKNFEISTKTDLATLFQGEFINLLQSSVLGFAQRISPKYYKITGIVSGVVVVSLPFILKFLKKKHWAFYVLLGIAEILSAFLLDKEKEQHRVILAQ